MVREFKDEGATVRVFGKVNEEAVKKATVSFLKGVEDEKRKNKKKTA
jgi:hypothetical protein